MPLSDTEIKEVLGIFAFDDTEDLWWRFNEEDRTQLDFYTNCSDFFAWGCADCELITSENLPTLRQAKEDLPDNFALLFAARSREMRPQGAYYKYLKEASWPLFDACGEPRETGFGNPVQHPSGNESNV